MPQELKDELKVEILEIINSKQGCKQTDLIPALSRKIILKINNVNGIIFQAINELVEEKKIVRIEYILSSMPYREKSFLLPLCDYVKITEK